MADTNKDVDSLAAWISEKVSQWEAWRDSNYKERWDEYYRLWRGMWVEADKNRMGERSRIISPELSQSIETSVAELEEATFIRDRWIDIEDDYADQDKGDVQQALNLLLDEFEEYNAADSISESYLNGAIYGTGIAKIVVQKLPYKQVDNTGPVPSIVEKHRICVKPVPICPRNFVIDPIAKGIEEALGCAHVFNLPLSEAQRRVASGMWNKVEITAYSDQVEDLGALGEVSSIDSATSMVKVIEWHGLVPKSFISEKEQLVDGIETAIDELLDVKNITVPSTGADNEELVEAIVTVLNDAVVAKAVINPFLFGDRSIVAFQYDTVPNRFWGRGIAEKGYNPQKALDAEIRARIDALALSTHPMMGIDSTKIPRGETFQVRPGRSIMTTGNPSESLMPIKFPPPDPHTFQQTQELREMIQRATGAYELPANADTSRMAATSMSMVVGSMIKRSRRTLSNIERQFLRPLVEKTLRRYMQFDPERFPMKDYRFNVKATMGIMAREFEQGQLVSLLSTVPSESPAFWMLIRGIYTNSNIEDKEQMVQFANQMLEKALNPQPPPPDPKVMADMEKLKFEQMKHKDMMDLEATKLMQIDRAYQAEAVRDVGEGRMQTATAMLQAVKAEMEQVKTQTEALSNIADAKLKLVQAETEKARVLIEALAIKAEASQPKPSSSSESPSSEIETKPTEGVELPEEVEDSVESSGDIMKTLAELKDIISNIGTTASPQSKLDEEALRTIIQATNEQALGPIREKLDSLSQPKSPPELPGIERDPQTGRVVSIGGKPVKRNGQGLIEGISED